MQPCLRPCCVGTDPDPACSRRGAGERLAHPSPHACRTDAASDIREVLTKGRRWAEVCGTLRRPSPEALLVFLGNDAAGQEEGAAGAAAAGFQRTLALYPPLDAGDAVGPPPPPELAVIRPDALATLLGWGGMARELQLGPLAAVVLLDVRRWDERLLYGSIRGSVSLPGAASPPHDPGARGVWLGIGGAS